jgi:hypothetical protein
VGQFYFCEVWGKMLGDKWGLVDDWFYEVQEAVNYNFSGLGGQELPTE